MSTFDEAIALQRKAEGFNVAQVNVPCLSLSSLLERYREREIHWLKIDVEGMEAEVVESWLPSTVRPWIVVVESTVPSVSKSSHASWDPLATKLGCTCTCFDGLNRFYVSNKHLELASCHLKGARRGPARSVEWTKPLTLCNVTEPVQSHLCSARRCLEGQHALRRRCSNSQRPRPSLSIVIAAISLSPISRKPQSPVWRANWLLGTRCKA